MKIIKLCIAATIIYINTYGQNTPWPSSGNVGIGTLTPANVPGYSSLSLNSNSVGGLLDFQQGGNSLHAITGNQGGMFLMASAGLPMYMWTDGNEKMSIMANGNVGIGNHFPQSRLEVACPSTSAGASGTFHLNGSQAWGHVLTLATDHQQGDDPRLLFSYRNNSKHWALGGSQNSSNFGIWEDCGDGVYGANVGVQRFTVLPGGNVGIGVNNPDSKLCVKGGISASEVKVQVRSDWPDYVFKKEYELPSLDELEKRIKQIGHLPGIPSATEVNANGIELGEMNKKLLKQIEELTLYLFELKKENTEIKDRMDKLEKGSGK